MIKKFWLPILIFVVCIILLILWLSGVLLPNYPQIGLYILKTDSFYGFAKEDSKNVCYISCIEISNRSLNNYKTFYDKYNDFVMISLAGDEYKCEIEATLSQESTRLSEYMLTVSFDLPIQEELVLNKIKYYNKYLDKVIIQDIGAINITHVKPSVDNHLEEIVGIYDMSLGMVKFSVTNNHTSPIYIADIMLNLEYSSSNEIVDDMGNTLIFPISLEQGKELNMIVPVNPNDDIYSINIMPILYYESDNNKHVEIIKNPFEAFNLERFYNEDNLVKYINLVYGE